MIMRRAYHAISGAPHRTEDARSGSEMRTEVIAGPKTQQRVAESPE
jgi:hypothetical protein